MKKSSDSELCEIINRRLDSMKKGSVKRKPHWHELKANLRLLEIPTESIRHIKKDCKERKTAKF